MLKKILIALVVVVAGFLIFAATRPDTYRVERSAKIDAPASVIFAQLEDFKAWQAWSPWDKRDPTMKRTYEGPATGVGSIYSWEGNKDVGKGKMTIVASEPPSQIKYRLDFIEPFTAVANTAFTLAPESGKPDGKPVAVTWAMDGTNNIVGKIFSIFMNMDTAIGSDFEKGLGGLKTVAESEAQKQAAAQAQAAAVAAAQAAKVAADVAAAAAIAAEAAAAPKGTAKK